MKRLAMMLMSGALAAASLRCAAEPACTKVTVEATVETERAELTLADLLTPGTCAPWREAAARVSLGAAPRAGSVRVLDGRQTRRLLEDLADRKLANRDLATHNLNLDQPVSLQIPERIVVQ